MTDANNVGSNLSNNPYLTYLTALSPEGLEFQMKCIRKGFTVISIYFAEGKHVAWVSPTEPIEKIKRSELAARMAKAKAEAKLEPIRDVKPA